VIENLIFNFHCKGCCNHSSCFLSTLRGLRNGAVYGAKIRFPHALVMTMLFRSGTMKEKVKDIIQATFTHSRNLAIYVAIYKSLVCIMRHLRQKESPLNTLTAGFIGGLIIFGTDSPVNSQINMYILSRIIMGGTRTAVKQGVVSDQYGTIAYAMYAATCWALVMYLFAWQEGTLQKSLISSMTYLYQESDKWPEDVDGILDWFYF